MEEQPSSSNTQQKRKWSPAVVFALALLFVFVLFYSQVFAFFTAFPIFFISIQQGGVAAAALLLMGFAMIFYQNPLDAIFLVFTTGGAAVLAGHFFRSSRGQRIDQAILKGVLTTAILLIVAFLAMTYVPAVHHHPLVVQMRAEVQQNLQLFYGQFQAGTQSLRDFPPTPAEAQKEQAAFMFWANALIPGGLVALTALSIWIYFVMLRSWLLKQGFTKAFGPLRQWRSSEKTVWALIAVLTALILGHEPAKVPALNALIVIATVYLFQGIAILVFFLRKRKFPALARLGGYLVILVFFKQVAMLLVVAGFFDVWFDFRKAKGGVA